MEQENILEKILTEQVFSINISADNRLMTIEECCDNYFTVDLNKQEATQLLEEIKQLVDEMEG